MKVLLAEYSRNEVILSTVHAGPESIVARGCRCEDSAWLKRDGAPRQFAGF